MTTDDELLSQMDLQQESPDDPNQRKIVKVVYPKSLYSADDLTKKIGGKVWVKCIVTNDPFADGKPLKFWKDYLLSVDDAIMLDERRFAVILHSLESLQSMEVEKPKPTKTPK
jgi:hypothetical protein